MIKKKARVSFKKAYNKKGKNTTRIFQELDVIRRKQIDLASDHVALEAMNDIP